MLFCSISSTASVGWVAVFLVT